MLYNLIQMFLIALQDVKKNEAKKAKTTVKKTIIAPIATPGPAYACKIGGCMKFRIIIKRINLKAFSLVVCIYLFLEEFDFNI